jgi:hypothetical protein
MALKFGGGSYVREGGNIVALSVYVRRETAGGTLTFLVNVPCSAKFPNRSAAVSAITQFIIDNSLPAYFAARAAEIADTSDQIQGEEESL